MCVCERGTISHYHLEPTVDCTDGLQSLVEAVQLLSLFSGNFSISDAERRSWDWWEGIDGSLSCIYHK